MQKQITDFELIFQEEIIDLNMYIEFERISLYLETISMLGKGGGGIGWGGQWKRACKMRTNPQGKGMGGEGAVGSICVVDVPLDLINSKTIGPVSMHRLWARNMKNHWCFQSHKNRTYMVNSIHFKFKKFELVTEIHVFVKNVEKDTKEGPQSFC